MNTLTVSKTVLILVKVGGVQISQHSQILIKSDNDILILTLSKVTFRDKSIQNRSL